MPERTSTPAPPWMRRLDRIAGHRILGIPLFLGAMWVAFKLTTDVAAPWVDWIDATVSGPLQRWLGSLVEAVGLGGSWVESLVLDGILVGLGAVLAFVPVLLALYMTLAILEDTGYLARGAMVMDGAMRAVGLPGRAFLPMMLGFGCSVPALLALRSLERPRDRVLAGLMVPFMSCGARLPVYVLLATAFFVDHRTLAVFSMYLLGLIVAVALGALVGRTVLRGPAGAFLQPDPGPLRLPTLRGVLSTVGRRTADFLKDAGTVILGASLVVWLLMAIPVGGGRFGAAEVDDSLFATVSRGAAPVLEPLGFGDWRQAGALATGLVAKEVIVGTLAQGYGAGVEDAAAEAPGVLEDAREIVSGIGGAVVGSLKAIPGIVGIDLDGGDGEHPPTLVGAVRDGFEESSGGFGASAGLAFMVFVLLYTPCAASLATTRRELGLRWMAASAVGQLVIAWLFAFAAFRIGIAAGLG